MGKFLTEEQRRRLAAEMAMRGIRAIDVARFLGVTPGAVAHVVRGRKRIGRVILALKALGIPGEIFAEDKSEK